MISPTTDLICTFTSVAEVVCKTSVLCTSLQTAQPKRWCGAGSNDDRHSQSLDADGRGGIGGRQQRTHSRERVQADPMPWGSLHDLLRLQHENGKKGKNCIEATKQALFLDVFRQWSPTQNWRNLEFLKKFLEFFWKFLEFIEKNGFFFPKFLEFSQFWASFSRKT